MGRIDTTILGSDDYEVALSIWQPEGEAKGIVQIFHGMVEHILRYEDFAKYLNEQGFIVAGDDHRGHGRTAKQGFLGLVPFGHTYYDTIDDEKIITAYLKETYPNLPVFIFAHSYGSFLGQGYIQQNSGEIDGCILSGSAMLKGLEVKLAKSITKRQYDKGRDKPANLIKNLTFGKYEKPFRKEKRVNAWLNRSVEECEKYNSDPLCNYTMSVAFYKNFFDGLSRLYEHERLEAIDKKLPIFIVSGDKDPVGKMGRAVEKLYRNYKAIGIEDVQIKLYPDARHEIVNEINKDEVYADVSAWLNGVLAKDKNTAETKTVQAETAATQ